LLRGDFSSSLSLNPIGLLLFIILLVLPFWIALDGLFQKVTLWQFYVKVEIMLQRKWIAIPAIGLILANWIWNIYKGL
jgi:hypothetical protein